MAAGTDIESDGNSQFVAHSSSYALFIKMMKWGTIISAIVGFFVVFVLIA